VNLFPKLVAAMREAGYYMFTIKPDPVTAGASLMIVNQSISRLGTHPAFWDVLDNLGLDGSYGTQHSHQVKRQLPEGVYLTFV
jgi:hypothetical protein